MNESRARADLAEVCRLAYARGYICGVEGNFSIRLSKRLLLSTPRGICKGRVTPEQLVLTDCEGHELEQDDTGYKLLDGSNKKPRVSTEFGMHLAAYKERPDVWAVVHAHPTVAVGFTVAGQSLEKCVLPEVVCTLGVIPTAPYATPSTGEVSEGVAKLIGRHDAIMLDHHGALTVGADIWDAFYKLETLEHHAQTLLVAHLLGGIQPLYASQVQKLINIRGVYGLNKPLPAEAMVGPQCSRPDPEKVS